MLPQSSLPIIFFSFIALASVYNNAMAQENTTVLPEPNTTGAMSLEGSIQKRRSIRNYQSRDLTLAQVSQLLWAAQGITEEKGRVAFRSAPSAGALYPMEVYLLNREGVFHYIPAGHSLELHKKGDMRTGLMQASLGQPYVAQAPVAIVLCAVYERMTRKYGQRGLMYTHIEAGHIAQNIHLQAVALGLGSVPIGAFQEDPVKKVLSLPADHEPLYIIPAGYPE